VAKGAGTTRRCLRSTNVSAARPTANTIQLRQGLCPFSARVRPWNLVPDVFEAAEFSSDCAGFGAVEPPPGIGRKRPSLPGQLPGDRASAVPAAAANASRSRTAQREGWAAINPTMPPPRAERSTCSFARARRGRSGPTSKRPTRKFDEFGGRVALSGDTLAVSAPFEDSAAIGVGGDEANGSASESGAVYVWRIAP
jgi:hypothetical protein